MIRVTCPHCDAKYRFDESLLKGKKKGFAKCQKCDARIEVSLGAEPEAPDMPEPRREIVPPEDPTAKVKKMRSDEATGSDTMTMSKKLGEALDLPADKKYSLAVLQGKASGQIFAIAKSRTTIGRSGTDITLDDPECSRKHAVVEIQGARVTVTDLGSTNGTFVDGQRVDRQELDKHSEFRIGEHVMMLIVTDRE
jgi:predicted Zn finger-like uncharacterized protein